MPIDVNVGQFHVNGEAAIYVQTAGSNSSRSSELLGISADGVRGSLREFGEPVFVDTFGPSVPGDEQYFLADGILRLRLIWWVESALVRVRARVATYMGLAGGAGGVDGLVGSAGMLWRTGLGGGNGPMYFGLSIASPREGLPYGFPQARLLDAQDWNLGTRVMAWDLTFHVVLDSFTPGDSAGKRLYTRAMLP
jgi:hypothetical protein